MNRSECCKPTYDNPYKPYKRIKPYSLHYQNIYKINNLYKHIISDIFILYFYFIFFKASSILFAVLTMVKNFIVSNKVFNLLVKEQK